MVNKIDEGAFRAGLLKAWDEVPIPDDPDKAELVKMMKRANRLNAELAVFGMSELERYPDNPMQAIANIAQVISNNTFNVTERVLLQPGKEGPEGFDGPHAAIHTFVDVIASNLHGLYHAAHGHDGHEQKEMESIASFEMPRKDVGDA